MESKYFRTDNHDVPIVGSMMDDPEYFRRAKGMAFKIVDMTAEEYEAMLCSGFDMSDEDCSTVSDRISEERVAMLSEKMKEGEFNMPWIEFKTFVPYGRKEAVPSFSQEGHHRAAAVEKLGGGKFPVFVIYPTDGEEFKKVKRLMNDDLVQKLEEE